MSIQFAGSDVFDTHHHGKAEECLLSVLGALNLICPETLVRAEKVQGGSAASEVSLFHFPTQIKSSIATLTEAWRKTKN